MTTMLRVRLPPDIDHYLVCTGPHAASTTWPPQGVLLVGRGDDWQGVAAAPRAMYHMSKEEQRTLGRALFSSVRFLPDAP